MYSLGGSVVDEQGRVNIDIPEFRKSFELFVDFVREGAMPTEGLGWSWTDPGELFAAGKAGFIHDGTVDINRFRTKEIAEAIWEDWIATPPLSYDSGYPPAAPEMSSAAFCVNPYAKPNHQAAAMLWLDMYRSYMVQYNELVFEGNETAAAPLYDHPEVKKRMPLPEVKRAAIEHSKTTVLPPGGDQIMLVTHEWWQKAALGEVSVSEAIKNAQKEIDEIQAVF